MHNNQNYFDLEKREKLRHMQIFSDIFSYIINRAVEAGGVGGGGMAPLVDQLPQPGGGSNYAQQITTCPLGFLNLRTALIDEILRTNTTTG